MTARVRDQFGSIWGRRSCKKPWRQSDLSRPQPLVGLGQRISPSPIVNYAQCKEVARFDSSIVAIDVDL